MRSPGRRRVVATLALLVASIVFSLFVGEAFVRLVAPQSLIVLRPDIWMPVEEVGWRNRPNVDTRINTGEREVRWRTDARGFRIGAETAADPAVNIVALGDSFLAAMQVNDEDTMVRLLERRLSERSGRPVRIWNAGVPGWEPSQYRIELQRILDTTAIDGVLVFVYLGNDIVSTAVDSYPPRPGFEHRALRWPRTMTLDEWVEAIAYPVNNVLEARSHLFVFAKKRLKYLLMRVGLTPYQFPETLLLSQASSKAWGTTADILKDMADRAAARHVHTIFVLIPSSVEADPAEGLATARGFGIPPETFDLDQADVRLREEMERRHLTVVDATGALRSAIAGGTPDVYGRVDIHLGKAGHQVIEKTMEDPVWSAFFDGTPSGHAAN